MRRTARSSTPSRILVVDDRLQNVELLKAHLTNAGYVVETATGGQEALDKVAAHLPDLVLLDIVMPDVDGFQVCEKLKSNNDTNFVPVVVVTALKDSGDKIRALEVGADDFLSKPFDLYELLARVKSLLRIKALHDELEQYNQLLHRTLNRYMAEDVASLILEDPERYLKLGGEDRTVSVLFADIRGFTRFSERHAATEVVDVLNLVFTALTKTVFEYGGTFDKYLGDAVMAFFGAPVKRDDDALRAVGAAAQMQKVFQDIVSHSERDGLAELGLGIGINTGEAIVGNIGSEKIMDYTVIGDTANVARRLQEMAGKGQILIGQRTHEEVKDRVAAGLALQQAVKGRVDPIIYYEVMHLL
jgi:adenylate cyclase